MNQFADFLKVYKADELDLVRAVSVADATYSELMRKYEDHLKNIERPSDLHFISDNKIITEILTPAGINSFLQATQQYEVNRKYSWETGIIISCLLQNSYNYGYNDFYLEVYKKRRMFICIREFFLRIRHRCLMILKFGL